MTGTRIAPQTRGHDVAGQPRDYVRGHRSLHRYQTELDGLPDWTGLYVAAFANHIAGSPGARRLMRDLLTENAPQTAAVDYF